MFLLEQSEQCSHTHAAKADHAKRGRSDSTAKTESIAGANRQPFHIHYSAFLVGGYFIATVATMITDLTASYTLTPTSMIIKMTLTKMSMDSIEIAATESAL